METTEKLEFYKEEKGAEKIVKEKKIEIDLNEQFPNEQLAKEIAHVVSSKSEYKQIVVWLNLAKKKWDCTFRTYIIPLKDTKDSRAIYHQKTPACLSFEYRDKKYWVMRVEKVIDEEWDEEIEKIREMMRGALEAEKKQEPGFWTVER